MSIRALSWVFEQEIKPASSKLVLLVFADCANETSDFTSFPCQKTIIQMTSLDEKTVAKAIKDLIEQGYLIDTGGKKGRTQQVKVYRLNGLPSDSSHYVYRLTLHETGEFFIGLRSCFGDPAKDKYLGSAEWPNKMRKEKIILSKEIIASFPSRESAAVYENEAIFAHRDDHLLMNSNIPKNGGVPFSTPPNFGGSTPPVFPVKPPVFPVEHPQKRGTEPEVTRSNHNSNQDTAAQVASVEPGKKNDALKTKTPKLSPEELKRRNDFTDQWFDRYQKHFGRKYGFCDSRDGKAVRELLALSEIETIINVASHAWTNREPGSHCKHAETIYGLRDRWNQICNELDTKLKCNTFDPYSLLPENLNTPEFRTAWMEWFNFRKGRMSENHWETVFKKHISELKHHPVNVAIGMINRSISSNYSAIYPPKNYANNDKNNQRGIDRNRGTSNEGLASEYARFGT